MSVKLTIDLSQATQAEFTAVSTATASLVSANGNQFDFAYGQGPPASSSLVTPADVYKEIMQTTRYYGGVRYIIFPVFLTANAALVVAYSKKELLLPDTVLFDIGIALSVVWLTFELCLSENIRRNWKEIEKIVAGVFPSTINPLPHRRTWLLVLARTAFYVLYGVSLLLWIAVRSGYPEYIHSHLKLSADQEQARAQRSEGKPTAPALPASR